jgi:hypothetical protein
MGLDCLPSPDPRLVRGKAVPQQQQQEQQPEQQPQQQEKKTTTDYEFCTDVITMEEHAMDQQPFKDCASRFVRLILSDAMDVDQDDLIHTMIYDSDCETECCDDDEPLGEEDNWGVVTKEPLDEECTQAVVECVQDVEQRCFLPAGEVLQDDGYQADFYYEEVLGLDDDDSDEEYDREVEAHAYVHMAMAFANRVVNSGLDKDMEEDDEDEAAFDADEQVELPGGAALMEAPLASGTATPSSQTAAAVAACTLEPEMLSPKQSPARARDTPVSRNRRRIIGGVVRTPSGMLTPQVAERPSTSPAGMTKEWAAAAAATPKGSSKASLTPLEERMTEQLHGMRPMTSPVGAAKVAVQTRRALDSDRDHRVFSLTRSDVKCEKGLRRTCSSSALNPVITPSRSFSTSALSLDLGPPSSMPISAAAQHKASAMSFDLGSPDTFVPMHQARVPAFHTVGISEMSRSKSLGALVRPSSKGSGLLPNIKQESAPVQWSVDFARARRGIF